MKLPNNNKLNEEDLEQLLSLIRQTPDMTLAELAAALDHKVSVPTIWRATKSLGLSLKKSLSTRPNRTGPTSRNLGMRGLNSSLGPS